jgi:predicted permease
LSEQIRSDVRYAVRLFAKAPGWTAVAVASLTLGIAVNLLIFSIVDAVLLRPFPYKDPAQLVFIWGTKDDSVRRGISGLDLADWQARNRSFESIDAFLAPMPFSWGDQGETLSGACVGPAVLPMLGVQPALGRSFAVDDARLGADTVAIVSDGFWRGRLGGSPSVIGSTLRLNGRSYEVIGVTPRGFFFPDTNTQLLVSTPCGAANFFERGGAFAHAIGRLRPGISVQQAQSDLDSVNRDLARMYPDTNRNVTAGVQPFRNIVVGKYENSLWLLLSAVGVVLLIACANVAHLQLARGVDRQIELAIRAANGARRTRLFSQLLTESLVLSVASGAVALALTWWGIRILKSMSLTDIARLDAAQIDWRLAAVAAGLSLLAALVTGVWPAWHAAGVRINDVLKSGTNVAATPGGRRLLRDLLGTSEIALATLLLVLAGLLIGSFVRLSGANWGFHSNRLFVMAVSLPVDAAASPEGREEWKRILLDRLTQSAGVEAVATATGVPIRYVWTPTSLVVDGQMADWTAAGWTVGQDYFRTLGTRILEGREFGLQDGATATPVAVVSESLARKLWPEGDAVGKVLRVPRLKTVGGDIAPDIADRLRRRDQTLKGDISAFEVETHEVIGVVEDIRAFGLDLVPEPAFYLDSRQERSIYFSSRFTYLLVRTLEGEASEVGAIAKSILASGDLNGELRSMDSMSELVAHSIGGRGSNRLMMLVAGLFGGLALTLTTMGIFGVMLHTVNQRLAEMGVRIAFGARRSDIVRLVLGYGFRLLFSGVALGLTLAWAVSRSMQSLLFGLAPTDLATHAGAVLILVVAVLAACLVPVRRALSVDAARLLR